jgi:hypothetical protein
MALAPASFYDAFMTSLLRAVLLTAFAAGSLAMVAPAGALVDGRNDWTGYAWQQIPLAECIPTGSRLDCPLYHQKWDWKRNQWVDITVSLDLATGTLKLAQRLTNNDRRDDDHVCVTALLVDEAGRDIVAHHQNWHITPGAVIEKAFVYRSTRLDRGARLHIGSKQCRQGAGQDDALYARVLAGIAP